MYKIKIPVHQEHWLEGLGSYRLQGCVTSLKFVFNSSSKKKMHKSRVIAISGTNIIQKLNKQRTQNAAIYIGGSKRTHR